MPYDANHPFHLHGADFRVVAMERVGRNVTIEQVARLDAEGKIVRKLAKEPIKDTVTVPDGGFTIIRFYADNPGKWRLVINSMFHKVKNVCKEFQKKFKILEKNSKFRKKFEIPSFFLNFEFFSK